MTSLRRSSVGAFREHSTKMSANQPGFTLVTGQVSDLESCLTLARALSLAAPLDVLNISALVISHLRASRNCSKCCFKPILYRQPTPVISDGSNTPGPTSRSEDDLDGSAVVSGTTLGSSFVVRSSATKRANSVPRKGSFTVPKSAPPSADHMVEISYN
uniref:Uncharacterized protein n=1 Tax=Timema poppense TaxID=170557 RepID=A0A7R9DAY0_TIMPO|nr:unnamed protein product [Timema poppensis]